MTFCFNKVKYTVQKNPKQNKKKKQVTARAENCSATICRPEAGEGSEVIVPGSPWSTIQTLPSVRALLLIKREFTPNERHPNR